MMDDSFFPFKEMRPVQKDCIYLVEASLKNKSHLLLHAPTGLGKTVAVLAPAIAEAVENSLTVFFLTSRNTQHQLAVETVRAIKEKSRANIICTDIIGKQWMCGMENVERLYSSEFAEYCKSQRKEDKCAFYINTKTKNNALTVEAKILQEELIKLGPLFSESLVEKAKKVDLCPYEVSAMLARRSNIIIADYHYLFHPHISKAFLSKVQKELDKSIIIVDEAHNLPDRIRETLTAKLSTNTLKLAIREARKFDEDAIDLLSPIHDVLLKFSKDELAGSEKLIERFDLISELEKSIKYQKLTDQLLHLGERILEEQHTSFISRVADFLSVWNDEEPGFCRILSQRQSMGKPNTVLSYRCLDPAVAAKEVIEASRSTILISGTLKPTFMYKDILGFPKEAKEATFESPFPVENRLALIVPRTTTQFKRRDTRQFQEIAKIASDLATIIPGNVAIFFPSYELRDIIRSLISLDKPILLEKINSNKSQRKELLETFKSHSKKGAVLLGVSAGSFGEGIDLPGDLLQGVVIVGMPFKTPDLETRELICYYDKKFGKGWDYGYVLPAMTRVLQNAGRCIRSETDRGVIVFLDERYTLPKYRGCFDNIKVAKDYRSEINIFFGKLP